MSNRTIIELNHDYCPGADDMESWAQDMALYMSSGDPKMLPQGVAFIDMRHHSETSPIEKLSAENRELKKRLEAFVERQRKQMLGLLPKKKKW